MKMTDELRSLVAGDAVQALYVGVGAGSSFTDGVSYPLAEDNHGVYFTDNTGDTIYLLDAETVQKRYNGGALSMYSVEIFKDTLFTPIRKEREENLVAEVVHDTPFVCRPMDNGGWTMEIGAGFGIEPKKHGTYTNIDDLLAGIKDFLINGAD